MVISKILCIRLFMRIEINWFCYLEHINCLHMDDIFVSFATD